MLGEVKGKGKSDGRTARAVVRLLIPENQVRLLQYGDRV